MAENVAFVQGHFRVRLVGIVKMVQRRMADVLVGNNNKKEEDGHSLTNDIALN